MTLSTCLKINTARDRKENVNGREKEKASDEGC